ETRGGRGRDALHRRLRGRLQRGEQVDRAVLGIDVVLVAGRRRGRRHAVDRVGQVGGQRRVERHVVAHHSNEGGDVVIQGCKHRLVAVGPRHRHILQRDVVERRRLGGDVGGSHGVAGRDQCFHLVERGFAGWRTRDAIVYALGAVTIIGQRGGGCASEQAR